MRRIVENIGVALFVWAVTNRWGETLILGSRAWHITTQVLGQWVTGIIVASAIACAMVLLPWAVLRSRLTSTWEALSFDFGLPSYPFFAASFVLSVTLCGLGAWMVSQGSLWGVIPLALFVLSVGRAFSSLRRSWRRFSGAY